MKLKNILYAILFLPTLTSAGAVDDPLLSMVMIDQLETRNTDGPDPLVLDGQLWIGKDLNKLWIKAEIERVDGETEEAELQALYSRAITPFWDMQLGWRHDFHPKPERDWLALGVQGLAPYFFEVDAVVFIGEGGRSAIRFEAEYEFMFTQRLVLSPEIEINLHGKDDPAVGVGSGLSDIELGLRLRYEIRREFAPYIGINWSRKLGQTADFAKTAGDDITDTQIVAGIKFWF